MKVLAGDYGNLTITYNSILEGLFGGNAITTQIRTVEYVSSNKSVSGKRIVAVAMFGIFGMGSLTKEAITFRMTFKDGKRVLIEGTPEEFKNACSICEKLMGPSSVKF